MTYAEMVVFHRLKVGSSAAEMEDGAGYDPGDPATGRNARCIVVDGAAEAYDSIRWVNQLVESFLGVDPAGGLPALTDQGMDEWFGLMQQRWLDRAPTTFANIFEERRFRQDGSFATLLACEIAHLDGPRPQLTAVALGDAVLFHIRGGRLIAQFPPMEAADFDLDPDWISTQPSQRGRMRARLRRIEQVLEVGDRLFLATAPVASWIVRSMATDGQALWSTLDEIVHPHQFDRLATEQLRSGRMKNGDLTLVRVQITEHSPKLLADNIGDVSQNVQFTVYRPPVIRPESWYPMLALAHLAGASPRCAA
jgi:hypothetical protein